MQQGCSGAVWGQGGRGVGLGQMPTSGSWVIQSMGPSIPTRNCLWPGMGGMRHQPVSECRNLALLRFDQ